VFNYDLGNKRLATSVTRLGDAVSNLSMSILDSFYSFLGTNLVTLLTKRTGNDIDRVADEIRVARFFLVQYTKAGKIYQMTTKLTNARKIYLKVVKYSNSPEYTTTFAIPGSSKMYPNWDFWSEKKPSGNPGRNETNEPAHLNAKLLQLTSLTQRTKHSSRL
jgi:hypothetical protein